MLPRIFAVAAVAVIGAVATAKADQHCASLCAALVEPQQQLLCAVPDTSDSVAGIMYSTGPVQVSGPDGMGAAAPQTPVGVGDYLVVLEGGELGLSGPGCEVAIGGPSIVAVIPANGCACVISETQVVEPPVERAGLGGLGLGLLGLGVLGAGAAAIVAAGDGDSDPPVTP